MHESRDNFPDAHLNFIGNFLWILFRLSRFVLVITGDSSWLTNGSFYRGLLVVFWLPLPVIIISLPRHPISQSKFSPPTHPILNTKSQVFWKKWIDPVPTNPIQLSNSKQTNLEGNLPDNPVEWQSKRPSKTEKKTSTLLKPNKTSTLLIKQTIRLVNEKKIWVTSFKLLRNLFFSSSIC